MMVTAVIVKIIRWLIASILPTITVMLIARFLVESDSVWLYKLYASNKRIYFLSRATESGAVYCLLVMLSCTLAPRPKKYGMFVGFGVAALTLCATVIRLIEDPILKSEWLTLTITSGGMLAGLAIGVLLSAVIFKNKGWTTMNTQIGSNIEE